MSITLELPNMPMNEYRRFCLLALEQEWRQAGQKYDKYNLAHSYIVRQNSEVAFKVLADMVERYGFVGYWKEKPLKYLAVGGYKYWVMGRILNREPIEATLKRMSPSAL